jgi:hypothetical protein
MNPLETTVGMLFAAVLVGIALFFARRQQLAWKSLHSGTSIGTEQRRYLLKQIGRRLLGSVLLVLLAGMLVGSLYLDWDPNTYSTRDRPPEEQEAAKQALRFITIYVMTMMLLVMAILALAVFDLWAVARFGVQQQKQLAQEHQDALEAELAQLRQKRAELN